MRRAAAVPVRADILRRSETLGDMDAACALRWREGDHLLFHEYFHGETGRGLGAAHQTGWSGCIALLLSGPDSPWRVVTAQHPQAVVATPAKRGVEAT